MSRTNIEKLPQAERERWEALIDRVNDAVNDIFGEDEPPSVVLGAQWGQMGKADNYPVCLVSSNLGVCLMGEAVREMQTYVDAAHDDLHDAQRGSHTSASLISPEEVPEEIREAALRAAREAGIPAEEVQFVQVTETIDLSDLARLPETEGPVGLVDVHLPDERDEVTAEDAIAPDEEE